MHDHLGNAAVHRPANGAVAPRRPRVRPVVVWLSLLIAAELGIAAVGIGVAVASSHGWTAQAKVTVDGTTGLFPNPSRAASPAPSRPTGIAPAAEQLPLDPAAADPASPGATPAPTPAGPDPTPGPTPAAEESPSPSAAAEPSSSPSEPAASEPPAPEPSPAG